MAAPYDTPAPGTAGLGLFADQAKNAYQKALLRIQDQRNAFLRESGIEGVFDDKGALTDYKVGAGADSQFGGYQTMMRGLGQAGEENEAAGRGLGFGGGLARQMQDTAQRGYEGATLDFSKNFSGAMGEYGQAEQDASQTYNDALYQQMLANVQKAISGGAFNPADMTGVTYDEYGNPTTPWKPPKTKKKGRGR